MASKLPWTNASFAMASLVALFCAGSGAGQEGQPAALVKRDASTLLVAARAALERGDWDTAEYLTTQAERIPRGLVAIIKSRWTDTPAKVRRDIQAARIRATQAPVESIHEPEKKDPDAPPKIVHKSAAWKADEPEKWPAFRATELAAATQAAQRPPPKTADVPVAALLERAPSLAAVQNRFFGAAEPLAAGPFTRQPPLSASGAKGAAPEPVSGRDSASKFTAVPRSELAAAFPKEREPSSSNFKAKHAPSGESAVALLKESGQAFVAGDFAGARRHALQAKKLRPGSTWDQNDIANVLSYLRRPAPIKESADLGNAASSNQAAAKTAPPSPVPGLDATSSVRVSANDEECEPVQAIQAQWERRTTPVLSSGWCVLIGMGIGVALILLFRHLLACQPQA
jgi:hypothetical protein